jgi:Macrocin-O-methyltransferase (TylF)
VTVAAIPEQKPPPPKWPYRADRPQRYSGNYELYRRNGGPIDVYRFVKGFVSGGTNDGDMARFYFFCSVFDQIVKEDIKGDLVELGVYKGNTASLLAHIARARGATAYLLDTFSGFDKKDIKGVDAGAREEAFADTSLEAVRSLVGEDSVKYIQGYFPETADQLPANATYSLVHVDCDLFAPIVSALEYFYPRMTPGGFLIVHDYSSLHWNGAEKAVDEFFSDKPEAVIALPDSAGSVVIRKARYGGSGENWLLRKRAALTPSGGWAEAGKGALRELLGDGWSGPEPWGVWGIGESHELHLVISAQAADELELEVDVHAALVGTRTEQRVEVWLDGENCGEWIFTQTGNRGIRSVRLRLPTTELQRAGLREMKVVFRPASVGAPVDLDPSSSERRPLGVALHRVRCVLHQSTDTGTVDADAIEQAPFN